MREGFNKVRGLLKACMNKWQESYEPGWLLTADETMLAWEGMGDAHLTFMKRKPTPLGYCMRTTTCSLSGILLVCEFCEGKEVEQGKEFNDEWGAHTGATMRLVKNWFYTGRVVIADSWFGSFRCAFGLLDKGLFSVMNVKRNTG